jgi:WD40 repeat protein/DNA-binding SARP family transcriptional activator
MLKLELKFLGLFSVTHDGAPVTTFESNKVRALLAYLAVESQRPHSRETLAALLWPDWPDSAARSNLRYALSDLRKTIDDQHADPPFLMISRDALQFNAASDQRVDVADFIDMASKSAAGLSSEGDIERLCRAVELYRGEFLDGFAIPDAAPFEEWVRLKREQLHRQYLEVLHDLAGAFEQEGDIAQALTYAWRGVELEPWQEAGQRQLMRLLALGGQRSAALAQYEACKRSLAEELQVEPSFETVRLYESIRDGTLEAQVGAAARLDDLPPAPGVPPFMGMQYFDEHDADLYFGRETLTARLVGHLRKDGERRFLAVVGASGSGKSSLVRAGLVPFIRRGEVLADGSFPPRWSHRWLVHVITPTAHPLEALATSLTREGGPVSTTASLIDDLAADPRSLHLYARRMTHIRNAPRLLLVVDQFEELFTLCRSESERGAFIENLLLAAGVEMPVSGDVVEGELPNQSGLDSPLVANPVGSDGPVVADQAGQDGPVVAVIALRADFYSHCAQYARLRSALSARQEYIGPMSPDELRTAIEQPAVQNDWEFEPGLVDLILHEVSEEPGALPLLSHALLETWHRRHGRALTLKGYAEAGGIHRAIAQTAESVYSGLTTENRELARRIFLRLTELGEGTQDTRRRVSLTELFSTPESAFQVEAVLNTLVEARLVTAGEGTVEVAHEALIREWPALRQWLDEDRESLRLHRHLTEAAQAWQVLERDPGELYRGARLAQALEWAAQPEDTGALNALEREFLEASRQLEEQELAEREAQRKRELEAAQRTAEAERQRAEEQARSATRLRRRALYLVGALLLALVMTGAAAAFASRNSTLAVQNAQSAQFASTQQAIAEAEANSRATQQAVAENARILADQRGDAALHAQATAEAERMRALDETRLATSRELALASVSNLDVDPDRGILLALHALSTADTREAREALHQAVQNSRLVFAVPRKSYSVAYSPDGKRLVIGEEGGMIVFYSNTGEELLRFSGFAEVNWPITFSPDGKRLATGDDDTLVKVWDAVTGEELLTLNGHTSYVTDIAFSPDGKRIATASSDKTAKLWDALSGQELYTITDHTDRVSGVSFSPDGKRLITSSHDNTVKVRDAETGRVLLTPQGDAGFMGVYSPDGTRFFTSSSDHVKYRMWDAATGQELFAISLGDIASFVFSTDGKRLVFGGQNGDLTVWDSLTGEKLLTVTTPIFIDVWTLSPDEIHAATVNEDGMTRVWDLSPKGSRELFTLVPHSGDWVRRVRYSPDGTRLATAGMDGTAKVFDAVTGNEILTLSGHTDSIFGLAYSPDGTRLATASHDRSVKVWDAATGELLMTLRKPGHGDGIYGRIYPGILDVAFSPDGTRLASAGADGTAVVWDALTGQEVLTLPSSNGLAIVDLAFNPEGTHLITTSDGNSVLKISPTARMWNLATGQLVFSIPDQNSFLMGLTVNNDGSRFLTGAGDGVLRVWDSKTGKELLALPGHTGTIGDITFSANGEYIATASADGTAILWDAGTGKEFLTLTGHTGWVSGVSFSPDGTRLATSSQDGTVRVYSLQIEDLIALAHSHLTRDFTQAECQQYLHLETCPEEGE